MRAERVEHRGRPWLAVGVGLLTAVVAIGANGPRPAHPIASPEVPTPMLARDQADAEQAAFAEPPDRHIIWSAWREFVDPRTGITTRVSRDPAELDRLLERRLAIGRPT